jgi:hypothetical protein
MMGLQHSGSAEGDSSALSALQHHGLRRTLLLCAGAALVLGTIGYLQYQEAGHQEVSFGNAVYHTAQLFALHTPHFDRPVPWALELARWLAAMTLFIGLVEFARRILRQETSHHALSRLCGHTVICGLGSKGSALVRRLCRQQDAGRHLAVVAIDEAPRPELVAECEKLGSIVINADATRQEVLQEARVETAARLFAVCPDDATNCEIAAQASHLCSAKAANPLECHIHVSRAELREALEQTIRSHTDTNSINLHFVDVFDPEALDLLLYGLPLDHEGITAQDPRAPHLVILGFGRMGRALALRAAQLGVFANGKRLRISVLDRRAEAHRADMLFRHPQIEKVADVQFHQLETASPEARQLLEAWCAETGTLTSVAFCFSDETFSLELALRLLPLFEPNDVRLAVRLSRQAGLAHLLEQLRTRRPQECSVTNSPAENPSDTSLQLRRALTRLRPFGMEERFARMADPEAESVEKAAREIHRAYVDLASRHPARDPSGLDQAGLKPDLQDWDALSEDLRESNLQQAAHLVFKLRAIGCEIEPIEANRPSVETFTSDELELLARMEHERWVTERLIANWTLAEEKDVSRRESPNLVPWEQLKDHVREYDRDAILRIPELLRSISKKICRAQSRTGVLSGPPLR